MLICARCGEANSVAARFCQACGSPLAADRAPRREVRKTVTVVFVDLIGSTPLGEQFDAEAARDVVSRYFDALAAVVSRHGGTVEKFIGDAIMAVFGVPLVHEDDALRALRAAVEMRVALDGLNDELERTFGVRLVTRTGIATGEVVAGDASAGQRLVTGEAVNLAARLERAAGPGEILLGESTLRLVRDAVRAQPVAGLTLKGIAAPVTAWRLDGLDPTHPTISRGFLDAPLVGRERESALLRTAYEQAVAASTCHLFTLLGSAGVGKSRLVTEFAAGLGNRATVVRGGCLPYGEGITLWPVKQVIEEAAGIEPELDSGGKRERLAKLIERDPQADAVVSRLGAVVGLAEPSAPSEEVFWAVRRLLEMLSQERPLVVVWDDIQWGEAAFLDLVEHLADSSRGFPILIVCLARPELLDVRSGWGGGKLNATATLLEPLVDDCCVALIAGLLGPSAVAEQVSERICAGAEGNPLFVEEMLAMLIDEGVLATSGSAWELTTELEEIAVPPTIQALLAARLDRLPTPERATLERASVLGKDFALDALAELAGEGEDTAALVLALVRKELLRPEPAGASGSARYRFRHILVRDSAYASLPKTARADLHEGYAGRLERLESEGVHEYDEIVGYHLEQAFGFRRELGRDDERTRVLGERAASRLGSAGRRAHVRGDATAAANLLDRASSLLPPDHPDRLGHQLELAEALVELGEFGLARAIVDDAAGQAKDEMARAQVDLQRISLLINLEPETVASSTPAVDRALAVFTRHGDRSGIARALEMQARVAASFGHRFGHAHDLLERALEHAGAAADERRSRRILLTLTTTAFWGPMHADEAIKRCEEILDQTRGDRRAEAGTLVRLAGLRAMRGDFDRARSELLEARALLEEMNLAYLVARTCDFAGLIELLAGDPPAAEHEFRAGFDDLERMGERGFLATSAALLARALLEQGRLDEAERFITRSEHEAAPDDGISQVRWRSLRGRTLAAVGRFDEAERCGRRAVEIGDSSDELLGHADALIDLAEVLRASGRDVDAVPLVVTALDLYEQKGVTPYVDRARALLETLPAREPQPDAAR